MRRVRGLKAATGKERSRCPTTAACRTAQPRAARNLRAATVMERYTRGGRNSHANTTHPHPTEMQATPPNASPAPSIRKRVNRSSVKNRESTSVWMG